MKVKALIYCTKAKPYLVDLRKLNIGFQCMPSDSKADLNGKIACECEVETEEIERFKIWHSPEDYDYCYETSTINHYELLKRSCLDNQQMKNYLEFNGYALYLSNIKERVMELSKCYTKKIVRDKVLGSPYFDTDSVDYHYEKREELVLITKAPQNMMWGYVYENGIWVKYLLISVRPQWLCLISNNQKDIEVRRKVLKGMVVD